MGFESTDNRALLTVSGLRLSRGGRLLAERLDFALAPGGVLLLRGPNGAGKSTLLLTLAGVLRPEAGTITFGPTAPPSPTLPARGRVPAGGGGTIAPQPPGDTSPLAGEAGRGGAPRAEVTSGTPLHILTHAAGLKPRLTLAETLGFWRTINGPGDLSVPAALDTVGLGGLGGIEVGHLSTGQGKRLALARLLLSPRKIWLLDEPSAALDTDGQALLARLIDAHAAAGGAAIVVTHDALALTAPTHTLRLGMPA